MKHDFIEAYERVVLMPLSSADAEKMRVLRNKYSRNFFNAAPIAQDAQQVWYQKYLNTPNDYMFSVYLKAEERWIGAVSIYDVNTVKKTAEFGRILIDRDATEERRLGLDTTLAACRFAFNQLGVEDIRLEVYANNIPAVRTYIKAGFLENSRLVDEENREIIYMSIHKNN